MKQRLIGYCRVSTDEQAGEGCSLVAQRERMEAYCKLYDAELVTVLEDPGLSGRNMRRPGLQKALGMLRAGMADGIIVPQLDRLTRSVSDMATLVTRWFGEKAGFRLVSVADQVDTKTAGGRLVLNVLVSVAQWEREAGAERTANALRGKRNRGEVYSPVPLGFVRVGDNLVPDPEEIETIQRVVGYRDMGFSLRRIAQRLTEEGRKTKRGGAWRACTVAVLLERIQRDGVPSLDAAQGVA